VEVSNQPAFALPSPTILPQIVDQAVDAIDGGALQLDLADIYLGRICGTEDRGLDAATGRIGRKRGTGIAVGRHRHVPDAERLAHRHRHHKPRALNEPVGKSAFILDDDFTTADFLRELRQI